ncbi:uncharacterized protein KY384_005017 [Bacidia gigantensis]|uniref:uncharacterized protein n=1 Tax=Bacidia gigantensis TaxID=2732470 RepID=UPI001D04E618|nr:uncharacterized protein KY384_005017 [Bacidia gigantensis]KAG8530514.1 hypothetical protein KY384_005017 [Bacidia gigantensis]
MVLVMGVTGSGKSYFVNKLANGDVVQVGDDLHSYSQILEEISRVLTAQHEAGVPLKGVIYLHRITDIRYAGSSIKTLEIFKKICGDLALQNVILVSTRWNEIDEETGAFREQQLRSDFWAYMLGHDARMARFDGSRDSAIGIVSQLVSRQSIVLELQRELVDERKTLQETVAGAYVNDDLSEKRAQLEKEVWDLEKLQQRTAQNDDRAMRRQIELDRAREQRRLQVAREDEERLRKQIALEVHTEIEGKKKKKGKGLWAVLPFLPAVMGIIEMFVGIPPGSTALLTSWFSESGIGESVSDFFANF